MHKNLLTACCVVVPLLTANAEAELVTYQVSATVYDVYDPGNVLQGSIGLGNTITGTYTFEINVPDDDSHPEYALYKQTHTNASGFDLSVNNQSIKSDKNVPGFMHEIHMGNSMSDHIHVGSWGNTALTNGAMVNDVMLDLYDETGTAFNNTVLTATPPNLNAFTHRDIVILGNDQASVNYYHVVAKIDSLIGDAGPCNPTPELAKVNVLATVKDVWDPSNALGSSIQIGSALQGNYTVNTTTPDDDPAPEYGAYRHLPGSGNFGFELKSGGLEFRTNSYAVEFIVDMYNGNPSPDHYGAFSYGPNFPLANGATVEDIGIHLYDDSGNMLASAQLANTPQVLATSPSMIYKEIYIWGRHPNGIDNYHIIAEVDQLTDDVVEQPSLIAVSPASGLFDRAQQFDMAFVFQAHLPPVMGMFVKINGVDKTPSLDCMPGTPNSQNRQTFVCPNYANRIMPALQSGVNRLDFRFDLSDGTVISESVEWEMIGY